MKRLDETFLVKSGITTTGLDILSRPIADSIPFLRPASTQQRTIAGWISRDSIPNGHIHPAQSIYVSTNGEGSHTYAYVSPFEFACNSDVSVLSPKNDLTLSQKIKYARSISFNRFRFSYGRKPKGERLKSLVLPDFSSGNFESARQIAAATFWEGKENIEAEIASRDFELVRLSEVFSIRNGHGLDLVSLKALEVGGVRFVARSKRNNGVTGNVEEMPGTEPHPGGVLTCALNGEGGVLYAFLQDVPFYTSFHIAILKPIMPMTREELLFYCTCLRANRFKYSFGRQANRTLPDLMVPSQETIPGYVHGALKRVKASLADEIQELVALGKD
jgi:Type I restriction modification DNA specificity domain